MDERQDELPPWASKIVEVSSDSPQIKAVKLETENVTDSSLDINGQLINGKTCKFVYNAEDGSFKINDSPVSLRYCQIIRFESEDSEQRTGFYVQLSVRYPANRVDVYYRYTMSFPTIETVIRVYNICQSRLEQGKGIPPLWSGKLQIQVSVMLKDSLVEDKEFYVTLDKEALFLDPDLTTERPKYYLQFYSEPTDHSMEKAAVLHNDDTIYFESNSWKFTIQKASTRSDLTDVIKTIKPMPARYFQFPKLVPMHEFHFAETENDCGDTRSSHQDGENRNEASSHRIGDLPRPLDQYKVQNRQAASFADELIRAVDQYSQVEELSLQWIVAESEINEMMKNEGALSESETDMMSGGLDPNDTSHLIKCFEEIKELLASQRYDMALSRLKGTKKIYSDSSVNELRALVNQDDIQLLKKLYFHIYS